VTRRKPTKPVRIADDFSDPTIDPLIWGAWSATVGGTPRVSSTHAEVTRGGAYESKS